jgi:4-hydroxy-3-polyprenylbenzoate decarboxylase
MGKDLRWFIDELKKNGELVEIDEEVHWNLEAAAFSTMSNRVGGPAFLFKKIKGYPEGYNLLGECLAGSWKAPWRRIAIAAGAPKEIWNDPIAIQDELLRRLYSKIKPIIVSEGECQQNVHIGKDVNLFEFPWPYIHYGDGGRYGTWQTWACMDPDSGWVNWAQYRTMIHTKNAMGVDPVVGSHMYMIFTEKWERRGKAMPCACIIGGSPMMFVGATYSAPAGLWEAENIGGLIQAPLELVKCKTVDLYVPADAEIVLEGEIRPGERWDEGPFGEYVGFMEGPRSPKFVFRVHCITHRDNPILPFTVEGTRVNSSQAMSYALASELWRRMRVYHDWPVRGVYITVQVPWNLHIVSTEKPYPGYIHNLVSEYFAEKTSSWWGRLIIVDSEIDPTDVDQVMEDWSLNVHPKRDIHITDENVPTVHHQSFLSVEEKERGYMAHIYYDATDKVGNRRVNFEDAFSEDTKNFVIKNWKNLGFEEELEVKRRDYTLRKSIRDIIE